MENVVKTSTTTDTGQSSSQRIISNRSREPYLLVDLAMGVVDIILLLDFIFVLAGAAGTGFVLFIANIANAITVPFSGIFANTVANGHYVKWEDIVAIVIWTFCGLIALKLISIFSRREVRQSTVHHSNV